MLQPVLAVLIAVACAACLSAGAEGTLLVVAVGVVLLTVLAALLSGAREPRVPALARRRIRSSRD